MERLSQALKQGDDVSIVQLDTALAEQPACACPVKHTVQLDNIELWQEFYEHTNEMIITKAGRWTH